MQVTINVPDVLAEEARQHGLTVETYAQALIAKHIADTPSEPQLRSLGQAIDQLLDARKGNKLGDLNIKEMVHEGHKY